MGAEQAPLGTSLPAPSQVLHQQRNLLPLSLQAVTSCYYKKGEANCQHQAKFHSVHLGMTRVLDSVKEPAHGSIYRKTFTFF